MERKKVTFKGFVSGGLVVAALIMGVNYFSNNNNKDGSNNNIATPLHNLMRGAVDIFTPETNEPKGVLAPIDSDTKEMIPDSKKGEPVVEFFRQLDIQAREKTHSGETYEDYKKVSYYADLISRFIDGEEYKGYFFTDLTLDQQEDIKYYAEDLILMRDCGYNLDEKDGLEYENSLSKVFRSWLGVR